MAEELKKVQPWEAGLPQWQWQGQDGVTTDGQWQGGPGPQTWQGPQGSQSQEQETMRRVQPWDAGLPKGWDYSQRQDGVNPSEWQQLQEVLRRIKLTRVQSSDAGLPNGWDYSQRQGAVTPSEWQLLQEKLRRIQLTRVQPWDAGLPKGSSYWQRQDGAPSQGIAAPNQEPQEQDGVNPSEWQQLQERLRRIQLSRIQPWDAGLPKGWDYSQRQGAVVPSEWQQLQEKLRRIQLTRVQPWDAGLPKGSSYWQGQDGAQSQGIAAPNQEPQEQEKRAQPLSAGPPGGHGQLQDGAPWQEDQGLRRVAVWDAGLPDWKQGLSLELWWALASKSGGVWREEGDPHRDLLRAVKSYYALEEVQGKALQDMKHLADAVAEGKPE